MSDLDNIAPQAPHSAWQRMGLHDDAWTAPQSLYDLRTQGQVLAEMIVQPNLLRELFGDLTASDFGGTVHQSLFRTMAKIVEEGKECDIVTVAEAWSAEKQVGDPVAYVASLLDVAGSDFPSQKLRLRVEKLHRLSHLRRIRFLGELVQRHAEAGKTDPEMILEKLELSIGGLRSGCDINGEMLPYAPRRLMRRPNLVCLADVEAKPVPWLWMPYLAFGMINMLSGEPGSGKTYLALAFAAALSVGRIPFTGEPCLPLDVVYLSIENDPNYVVRPRFDLLEGNIKRFHLLQGAKTGEGPKARCEGVRLSDIPLLDAALKESEARLLVVDPIQSYLGGEVDMHRSNETRPVLDGLAALAKKYNVCLLILRHFAKATTGSAINRGLGSIDLTGATRTELHAGERDRQHVLAHAKSNIGPQGKSMGYELCEDGGFRWTGESSITASDLAATGNMTTEDRDAVDESAECLKDILRGGAKSCRDVFSAMKDVGVSIAAIKRAKKKLGVKSRKKGGSGDGWEWYLEDCEDGEIASS